MSISAISSAGATATSYATHPNSFKKKLGDDPMSQAISQLQSTDPALASKLSEMQKKVDAMQESGASDKDVQSTVKSTLDGLSSTETSELKSAMPAPPAGGKGHHGHHGGPPPSGGSTSTSDADSTSASSLRLSSRLDTASSTQNDAVLSFMSSRSSASGASSYSVM